MAKTKRHPTASPSTGPVLSPLTIGIVVVAAVLIVGGLIVLGNQFRGGGGGPVDISQFPTLGEATAPVTLIEYSDYG